MKVGNTLVRRTRSGIFLILLSSTRRDEHLMEDDASCAELLSKIRGSEWFALPPIDKLVESDAYLNIASLSVQVLLILIAFSLFFPFWLVDVKFSFFFFFFRRLPWQTILFSSTIAS